MLGFAVVLEIHPLPVLSDNYVHLLREPKSGAVAAVDPSVAPPVIEALDRLGWTLTHIFNTHHHWDHTGGNLELKERTGCVIVGPRADEARIPGIDVAVGEDERYRFGDEEADIFDIPGHTSGHIAFYFPESKALFCGDTLFSLGCGRLFEGTPQQMWNSLLKLRRLPGDTQVYCGHEYTIANARFAMAIDPANKTLKNLAAQAAGLRHQDLPTIPSLLSDECAANPFLRADDPGFARALNMEAADPASVFAEIRRRKDVF